MAKKVNLNRGSLVVMGAVAGLVAGMLVGPAMAQSPEPGGSNPPEHTLSVTGTGTIKVTPDVADVQLGVQITRDTVCACGRTFLCGLAPSNSTTALSLLSIVVTTRRTSALKAMFALLPELVG